MSIPEHYYYLSVNVLCVIFPFLLSFVPIMPFRKHWKPLMWGTFSMMLLFIPWDIFFTHQGIWGFNPRYITGSYLFGLPLEEWLFFVCIPYACIFSYECIQFYIPSLQRATFARWISPIIIALSAVLAIVHYNHWYTASACTLAGLLVAMHQYYWKSSFLSTFYVAWGILLVPFYIANGVLTGLTFYSYPLFNSHPERIADQIVWYNNAHNLGFRIWSVPADDFFYGMAMVLLVLTVYERTLQGKRKINIPTG
jgi:lycopene cyclase domain-containing protein